VQAEHRAPAAVSIVPEQGRLNRTSPGDADNDGYNELSGDYKIVAEAKQIDVTLTPHTPRLTDPALEIAGLPAGKLIVTVDGRLIDDCVRLANGNVLIVLPLELDRAATVSVRVR
jgi:hypothetical protein